MQPELLVRYRGQSNVTDDGVALAATGTQLFFDGFAEYPAVVAQALLCVAGVASTRFYVPPNMIAAKIRAADPVVTSEPDRLRFESFSQCCGVHARLDLLPEGLDIRATAPGTTNVDFGPSTVQALSKITRRDPLRVTVGGDAVQLQTLDHTVTERRVPLPERWVRGFSEVTAAIHDAQPVLQLQSTPAKRFLRSLPRGRAGQMTVWTAQSRANIRLVTRNTSGACIAAPTRLRILEPLAHVTRSLTAYTNTESNDPTPVAWVLEIPGGRLTISLSPDWQRGFSGEGGLLLDLASPSAAQDAHALRRQLSSRSRFSAVDAHQPASLTPGRVQAALTWLGMHGELGHDVTDNTYFWRHLPYPDDVLASDPPRLRDAHKLLDQRAVQRDTDNTYRVTSNGNHYRATVDHTGYRCTCPWIAKHGSSRGPCKHILASILTAQQTARVEPEAVSTAPQQRHSPRAA